MVKYRRLSFYNFLRYSPFYYIRYCYSPRFFRKYFRSRTRLSKSLYLSGPCLSLLAIVPQSKGFTFATSHLPTPEGYA